MQNQLTIMRRIEKSEETTYFEIPFDVPGGIERIDVHYRYMRHLETKTESGVITEEVNVIDFGLNAPSGFLGASGSNRTHIWVSTANSSAGFERSPVMPGKWSIIVGAYHVDDGGVEVTYDITFTPKKLRLLNGDLHTHSTASDGSLTPLELMGNAMKIGLDFLFLTDHNTFAQNDSVSAAPPGLTVIPGIEFTHYNGHCGLLGIKRPINSPFCVNTLEDMQGRLREAAANGALIAVNHPISDCPWKWGIENTGFDLLEIWNGGNSPGQNRQCIDLWHGLLMEGKRIPIIGGSDFHSIDAFRSLGCPTTWVYSLSPDPDDILEALRCGNGFVTLSHNGPTMSICCGEATLGGATKAGTLAEASFYGLSAGDEIHIINDKTAKVITLTESAALYTANIDTQGLRFLRFEVQHGGASAFAGLPRLISNPVYFE